MGPRGDHDAKHYALANGSRTVFYTPEVPCRSKTLMNEIDHWVIKVGICADAHLRTLEATPRKPGMVTHLVDEAERLTPTALELLRDRHDRTQLAMILIGMPGIDQRRLRPTARLHRPDGRGRAGRTRCVRGLRSGTEYPATVRTWRNGWEKFIPFLAFPPPVRRIIYTTNAIESLNYQLRKIIKTVGIFPNDQASVKLLWLAICNIEDKHSSERVKLEGRARENRSKIINKFIEGTFSQGWSEALGVLVLNYPDRLGPYLNR